jgi:hypothetical protein
LITRGTQGVKSKTILELVGDTPRGGGAKQVPNEGSALLSPGERLAMDERIRVKVMDDSEALLAEDAPVNRERRASSFIPKLQSIFKPPRLRVNEAGRAMTLTEVFFDFLFVLPLQSMFTLQVRDSYELGLFITFYTATFTAWVGESFFNTRFDSDDILQRLFATAQMLGVAIMAAGLPTGIGHQDATFIVGYVLVRGTLVLE